ncbi:XRE family transcriptional regulator [hot springs metagenome]|uniref:XRE family transcriptional regulator n=1 Tax=hot springs metagenome TaxID=433727 RepID=A0A5J4L4B3_9ZZZZ
MQNNVIKRLKIAVEQTTKGNLKQFALKCNIPYRTLQSYISGEREPGASNLFKIATQLCISIDWLLTGEGEMFIDKSKKVVPVEDIPKEKMKTWIDEFWQNASDDEKAWLKVEFQRVFPEFKEWLKMKNSEEELKSSQFKKVSEKKKTA